MVAAHITHEPAVQVDLIWDWLEKIPDPEIPVISLVDLGVVRDVAWREETLVVTITPTYSGCPATSIIGFDIEKALHGHGLENVEIIKQLSPAWTTDWITETGRQNLLNYGIAPPIPGTAICGDNRVGLPDVACPSCGSENTSIVSPFGSTPCKAHYRCADCLEPFDYFKCI